jgi:transposase
VFNVLEGSLVVCLANSEDVKGRKGHMLERQIIAIDEEVVQRIQSLGLERMLNLFATIPGLGHDSAWRYWPEVGPDMKQFPTGKQLSSLAGVCPGNKRDSRQEP